MAIDGLIELWLNYVYINFTTKTHLLYERYINVILNVKK